MEEYIYLVCFRDSKFREEGVRSAFYKEEDAQKESDRLDIEDYEYYYSVEKMEIK